MAVKGEGSVFELIRCADSNDWLAQRKQGIGGSDVASIMGLSKYRSPLELWLEKTGRVESPDLSDKGAIEWGNRLEDVVGAKYAENHPDRIVQRCNAVAKSFERPWAQASLDYEVKDGDTWGVLEIKTVGLRAAKDWDEGVPPYYVTQITHYMSVLDRPFADVAVLVGGQEYREYRIERDEEDIQAVNKAVDTFWNDFVLKDVAPALTNTGNEGAALATLHAGVSKDFMEISDDSEVEINELIARYEELNTLSKRYTDDKKAVANQIASFIGDSKGLVTGTYRVTWTRSDRSYFDKKRFEAEYPDLAKEFTSTRTANGGLRIKEL